MNNHAADRPHGRDLTSPADIALATAMTRAGEELGEVPTEIARTHLDAITALAAAHAHSVPTQTGTVGWRVRLRRVAGLTVAKVALGAGVAAAAAGGLAATGHLPDPVQQVVSDGARRVGIHLPQPSDPSPVEDQTVHEPTDQDQDPERVEPTPPRAPLPPAEQPAQDSVDTPDEPADDTPPRDLPVDQRPGSPPATTPAEQDRGTPPRPQPEPEPEPTPEQERPAPGSEASPSPGSPDADPGVPGSQEPGADEGAEQGAAGDEGDPGGDDVERAPATGGREAANVGTAPDARGAP